MTSLRLLAALAAFVVSASAAEVKLESAFNGKDLAGWKTSGPDAFWTAADGVLAGENKESFKDYKKGNMLFTEKSYQDVVIECEVRFDGEIDSGIMVRKDAAGKKDIQMQIGVSRSLKKDMTGAFYVGKYPEAGWAPKVASLWKNGEWNKVRLQAKGDTYTVWINGEQVSNYVDAGYPMPAPVGLQVHGNVKMKVEYRNIAIGEIK
ncbi:MAG: hypothetical protein CAK86_03405 [Opitutia bacterium AMD-G1]|nr:MAG: hypothetical protein CAK86_03405 [Opitutae bacterium AMD-G1]